MSISKPERERLTARVQREVRIPALPETVWRFLATDQGWSAWWGPGSHIDPHPGGAMHVQRANGNTADGRVLEIEPGRRLVISWGYDVPDASLSAGASIVEIDLDGDGTATTVRLVHLLPSEDHAREHAIGWRYLLGHMATVVAHDAWAERLPALADAWHRAWAEGDQRARRQALEAIVSAGVRVIEPMAQLQGLDDLETWIRAAQEQMPATVRRTTPPALCGDVATWDWQIVAGGEAVATGRTVARIQADGRFAELTGLWLTAPAGVPTSTI